MGDCYKDMRYIKFPEGAWLGIDDTQPPYVPPDPPEETPNPDPPTPEEPPVGGDTELDITDAYYTDLERAFVFDEPTGVDVKDYCENSDLTLAGGPSWTAEGVEFSVDGQMGTCAMPTMRTTGSIVMIFKSVQLGGSTNATLFGNEDKDFDFRRIGDAFINFQTNNASNLDSNSQNIWGEVTIHLVVTWDETVNEKKLYVNGVLTDTDTAAFIMRSGVTLSVGNTTGGGRTSDGIFSQFLYYDTRVLDEADAAALYADPYRMFNNPPAR